jgi:hypothetical protein
VKIVIDEDEWYPVFSIKEERYVYAYDVRVEVTEEQVARWRKVFEEFELVQDELRALARPEEDK